MLFIAHVLADLEYLTKIVEVDNCYGPDTSVHFTKANSSICLKLELTNNERCNVF